MVVAGSGGPAQEGITHALEQTLTLHHPLALMLLAAGLQLTKGLGQGRGQSLLALQQQQVVGMGALQQGDAAASAHRSHAHRFVGGIEDAETADQVAAMRLHAAQIALQQHLQRMVVIGLGEEARIHLAVAPEQRRLMAQLPAAIGPAFAVARHCLASAAPPR